MSLREALEPFVEGILKDAKAHKELWIDWQFLNPLSHITLDGVVIQDLLDLAEAIESQDNEMEVLREELQMWKEHAQAHCPDCRLEALNDDGD